VPAEALRENKFPQGTGRGYRCEILRVGRSFAKDTAVSPERDRRFESAFLQRGVYCEPYGTSFLADKNDGALLCAGDISGGALNPQTDLALNWHLEVIAAKPTAFTTAGGSKTSGSTSSPAETEAAR
jgi:hypothetical protein